MPSDGPLDPCQVAGERGRAACWPLPRRSGPDAWSASTVPPGPARPRWPRRSRTSYPRRTSCTATSCSQGWRGLPGLGRTVEAFLRAARARRSGASGRGGTGPPTTGPRATPSSRAACWCSRASAAGPPRSPTWSGCSCGWRRSRTCASARDGARRRAHAAAVGAVADRRGPALRPARHPCPRRPGRRHRLSRDARRRPGGVAAHGNPSSSRHAICRHPGPAPRQGGGTWRADSPARCDLPPPMARRRSSAGRSPGCPPGMSRVSPMVFPSGDQFEIAAAGYAAVVTESGAALRVLRHHGRDLVHGFDEAEMSTGGRGQLLMPWPNRIRDGRYSFGGRDLQLGLTDPRSGNASHGLARWAAWTLEEHTATSVSLVYRRDGADRLSVGARPARALRPLRRRARRDPDRDQPLAASRRPTPAGRTPTSRRRRDRGPRADRCPPGPACWSTTGSSRPAVEPVSATTYDFTTGAAHRRPRARRRVRRPRSTSTDAPPSRSRTRRAGAASRCGWTSTTGGCRSTRRPRDGPRPALAVEPMTAPADAFNSGTDLVTLAPAGTAGDELSVSWGIHAQLADAKDRSVGADRLAVGRTRRGRSAPAAGVRRRGRARRRSPGTPSPRSSCRRRGRAWPTGRRRAGGWRGPPPTPSCRVRKPLTTTSDASRRSTRARPRAQPTTANAGAHDDQREPLEDVELGARLVVEAEPGRGAHHEQHQRRSR